MRISAQGPTEEHVVAGSLSLCTIEAFAFTFDKKTERKENGLLCRRTSFSEVCSFFTFSHNNLFVVSPTVFGGQSSSAGDRFSW